VRVLVAMSGGVDSSVAAALLADAGHEVVGCTLQLWGGESDTGCCSAADVEDARRVAQVLGIDHHVFNLEDDFAREVVDAYVAAHERGSTPNPCVACNRSIKFGALLERSARLGFDAMATGHHARVTWGPSGPELRRGADAAKDQSYVLGFLTVEHLARTLLPVGEHKKDHVRELAARWGLRTAAKPDSQDVCFIPRGARSVFLAGGTQLVGAVVLDALDGTVLGEVPAVQLVTVGQRRGVARGVDGTARYVVDVDVDRREVRVAPLAEASTDVVALDGASLTWSHEARGDGTEVLVQTSAHGVPVGARVWGGAEPRLELSASVRPVAPGQAAVLYDASDPDLVVGAATVARRALLPA
jgi:tRNA-specific 2-thiouridylase